MKLGSAERLMIGVVAGYALNYAWENFQWPGWGKKAFDIPGVEGHAVGWDDAAEAGIGVALLVLVDKEFGVGFLLGVILAKVMEIARSK